MKKSFPIILVYFLLTTFCSCSRTTTITENVQENNNDEEVEEKNEEEGENESSEGNDADLVLRERNIVRIKASNGEEDIINNCKYFYSDGKLRTVLLRNNEDEPIETNITYEDERIDSLSYINGASRKIIFTYEYPSENQINISSNTRAVLSEFYLQDNKPVKVKGYTDNLELVFTMELMYNRNDNVDSLIVIDTFGSQTIKKVFTYTYDNKNVFYENFDLEYRLLNLTPEELAISKNNVLSTTVYDGEERNLLETISYEYNSQGYPILMERFDSINRLQQRNTFSYE